MPLIPTPKSGTENPVVWADWLEISALSEKDGSVAFSELESEVNDLHPKKAEEITTEVVSIIKSRVMGISDYPFNIDEVELRCSSLAKEENYIYIFLLLLSYYGAESSPYTKSLWGVKNHLQITDLFEYVCEIAARSIISNDKNNTVSRKFGVRRGLPHWLKGETSLKKALPKLKESLGQGDIKEDFISLISPVGQGGDGGLDLIIWCNYPDKRDGRIFILGQCATSKNHFMDKFNEVDNFLNTFMSIDAPIIKAFFIPHDLLWKSAENSKNWLRLVKHKLLPFDRARIVFCTKNSSFPEIKSLVAGALKNVTIANPN